MFGTQKVSIECDALGMIVMRRSTSRIISLEGNASERMFRFVVELIGMDAVRRFITSNDMSRSLVIGIKSAQTVN